MDKVLEGHGGEGVRRRRWGVRLGTMNHRWVGVALSAALMVSGCGGEDDGPTTTLEFSAASGNGVVSGQQYVSPDGRFALTTGSDWVADVVSGVDAVWAVGEPVDGYQATVTVLVQNFPSDDPQVLLDTTVQQLEATGLIVLQSGIKTVADGRRLAFFDYVGAPTHTREVHVSGTVAVANGTAVMTNFTALPEQWDKLSPEVLPYLDTIENLG